MKIIAFEGSRLIASGEPREVTLKVKEVMDRPERGAVLIFDSQTSETVEVDFRDIEKDIEVPRRPGRPKLGVVAREVTLLPRHWEWLNGQPGGASVALRKLVEEARKVNAGKDRIRLAREATYRFVSAMAGNEPRFEEAIRALFAGDAVRFREMIADWPVDIKEHAKKLAEAGE
jgi:hypothetical protein